MILNGYSLTTIHKEIKRALDYMRQSGLYTDRALIKDSSIDLAGLYESQEDFRQQYIDFYITPYLDNGLNSWLTSPTGILLVAMTAGLLMVAIIFRSGLAALAALASVIVSWFTFRGGFM